MADPATALRNLERGFAKLEAFAALPIENDRDKAGLIQAFEYTFELFWKCFQKLAPGSGLEVNTPREALMAGASMGFVSDGEAGHWALMLRDRNLSSHTYNADVADGIVQRLLAHYLPCYRATIARLRNR